MSKIACVGAGTVGRAWGVVFARAGHEVMLYDALPGEVTERALPLARQTLELLAQSGLLDEPVERVFARLRPAGSIAEAVHGAADKAWPVLSEKILHYLRTRFGSASPGWRVSAALDYSSLLRFARNDATVQRPMLATIEASSPLASGVSAANWTLLSPERAA